MWATTERQVESYKIWLMAILLTCGCISLYYFHVILGIGTIVTHIFYVPIILASIWWKRKGLVVALFSSGFLIVSHVFLRPDMAGHNDYFRAFMFIVTAFLVAELSRRIAKEQEALQAANRQLKAGEQQLRANNQQLRANEQQLVSEVTERKSAEERARKQREFLRNVIESLGYAFYVIDAKDKTVKMANSTAWQGKLPEKITCYMFSHKQKKPCSGADHPCPLEDIKKTKQPVTVEHIHYDKDGNHQNIEVHAYPIFDKEQNIAQIIEYCLDITERKKAEEKLLDHQEKLKSLASQLSVIEERERHRLATELHDQIGQSLVMSKMKLDSLRESMSSGLSKEVLDEVCNCLGNIIHDTRTLTFDLSSPILYELGFEVAVADWLNGQVRDKHGIETEFQDDGQPKPLDDDIRALLFRNVRELLINIVKHANSRKVKVSVSKVEEQICVIVEDDGVGFDVTQVESLVTKKAKFGLFSIRERLERLDGHLEIESEPGRGSRFTMTAPLKVGKSIEGV